MLLPSRLGVLGSVVSFPVWSGILMLSKRYRTRFVADLSGFQSDFCIKYNRMYRPV